jgi:hypothetical protein
MQNHLIIASLSILLSGTIAFTAAPQQSAMLTLRSGGTLSGELVDLGGSAFTFRVNGQDRDIPKADVLSIDFGGGAIEVPDAARALDGGTHLLVLRNGDVVAGEFFDIGGANPIRLTFRTSAGERQFSGSDVRRIYMTRVDASGAAVPTGVGSTSGGGQAPPLTGGRTVQVSSTMGWTPVGITVRQGQVVRFEATGEIRINANDVAIPTGNHQNQFDSQAPVPSVLQGALIGRIVQGRALGTPFAIGNQATITMPASGQLYLGVNDSRLNDNTGQFTVRVVAQ